LWNHQHLRNTVSINQFNLELQATNPKVIIQGNEELVPMEIEEFMTIQGNEKLVPMEIEDVKPRHKENQEIPNNESTLWIMHVQCIFLVSEFVKICYHIIILNIQKIVYLKHHLLYSIFKLYNYSLYILRLHNLYSNKGKVVINTWLF